MLVEVGREVADAQAPFAPPGRPARQRPIAGGDVQRVLTRRLQLLVRIVDEHRVGERGDFDGGIVGQREDVAAQRGHHLVGARPAAGLALEEREQPARGEIAAVEAEDDRRAQALGGLGLHAEVAERHAEPEVRRRLVDLQRQRVHERADRFVVATAALERDRERDVVVAVARDVGRHRAQARDRLIGAAEADQRVRFERVSHRRARLGGADRTRAPRRTVALPGLDQRVRGGEAVRGVAVQPCRFLEPARRDRPLLALGVLLAGLPASIGTVMRGQRAGRCRLRQLEGHSWRGRSPGRRRLEVEVSATG